MSKKKIVKTVNDIPRGLREAVIKMCEIINIKPEDVDFSDPQWFSRYEWTTDQMSKFTKWFSDKLIEDREFRQVLLGRSSKPTRKIANMAAMEFVLMYGWRFKQDDNFNTEDK